MVDLQEFFGTANSQEELICILMSCGFKRTNEFTTPCFQSDNAFINLRKVKAPNKDQEKYGFVLELEKPLTQYSSEHPLRYFFKRLKDPEAYGSMSLPKYQIRDYLPK